MVVEEFHDQKIIYHLNIDEEVNNILMHLSSLKTIKTNRVIKGTTPPLRFANENTSEKLEISAFPDRAAKSSNKRSIGILYRTD